MKILYLCNKQFWDHKMSRVRFHSIDAIGRHQDVELIKSGQGWPDFKNALIDVKKYKPDIVVWYKPLDIPGYDQITVPKCLRYNEMWNVKWTTEEIQKSKSNLIICHHKNDIGQYKHVKSAKFYHNPHCAEKEIFKDYGLKKEYDILITGALSQGHYPFRARFVRIVKNYLSDFNFKILRHPGYIINNINEQAINYAREINKSYISLTCSSKHRYALAKYVEIPMSNSLLCADIPNENQEWYRNWILEINNSMSDEEIANKIREYLVDKKLTEKLVNRGVVENIKNRTQEIYADRFVEIVRGFFK